MADKASVTITQQEDFRFLVDFGQAMPALIADEPPPLGKAEGPSPEQMLLSAVANCLSASLLFALRKFKADPGGITATATCDIERNANNRMRVVGISVGIRLGKRGDEMGNIDRALAQFEDFCTVTQSVQAGIPVRVSVSDGEGVELKGVAAGS